MGNNGSKKKTKQIENLSNSKSKAGKIDVQNPNRRFQEEATRCSFFQNGHNNFDQLRSNLEKSNEEIGDFTQFAVELYKNLTDDKLVEKNQEQKKSFGTMTDDMFFADDEEIPENSINSPTDSVAFYKGKMKSMQRVIGELQAQLVESKIKAEKEKELIISENKCRENLLEAKYIADKKDLKKMWEQKLIYLSSKLIDDHTQEMNTFKNKYNQEKCNLEEQLDTVVAELTKFKEKYNILKATYEELRIHAEDMDVFIE